MLGTDGSIGWGSSQCPHVTGRTLEVKMASLVKSEFSFQEQIGYHQDHQGLMGLPLCCAVTVGISEVLNWNAGGVVWLSVVLSWLCPHSTP